MHLKETKLNETLLYDGMIMRVTKDQVQLEDGSLAYREIVHHSGGVSALPLTAEGMMTFVRQFRYPFQEALLEFPAGKLEKGEDPFDAAKRELLEETGGTSEKWHSLGEIYPTVAYDTEIIHLYLAEDTRFAEARPDAGEFIDIERYSFDEAMSMLMRNEIRDAKTAVMLLKLSELKRSGKIRF